MTSQVFVQGYVVGFLAAIPLGPMGMLCVQRTLDRGRLAGIVSACGLTVAAALWCVIAAKGLSNVARLVSGGEALFMVSLGVFLVVAGLSGLLRYRRGLPPRQNADGGSLTGQFTSSLLGVLLNPVTFVTMTAVLALLGGVRGEPGGRGLAAMAGAVFLGGMTVWLCVTQGVWFMKARLGETGGVWLSRALNGCILVLGIVYVVRPFLLEHIG